MFEGKTNSNKKRDPMVSKTILPKNKDFESDESKYAIKLPDWLEEILNTYENETINQKDEKYLIYKAFQLASKAHDGQLRASGEPYIIHPVAVADLLK